MKCMMIGVAGGTGSGKTTLTSRLKECFGDDLCVIQLRQLLLAAHRDEL